MFLSQQKIDLQYKFVLLTYLALIKYYIMIDNVLKMLTKVRKINFLFQVFNTLLVLKSYKLVIFNTLINNISIT